MSPLTNSFLPFSRGSIILFAAQLTQICLITLEMRMKKKRDWKKKYKTHFSLRPSKSLFSCSSCFHFFISYSQTHTYTRGPMQTHSELYTAHILSRWARKLKMWVVVISIFEELCIKKRKLKQWWGHCFSVCVLYVVLFSHNLPTLCKCRQPENSEYKEHNHLKDLYKFCLSHSLRDTHLLKCLWATHCISNSSGVPVLCWLSTLTFQCRGHTEKWRNFPTGMKTVSYLKLPNNMSY